MLCWNHPKLDFMIVLSGLWFDFSRPRTPVPCFPIILSLYILLQFSILCQCVSFCVAHSLLLVQSCQGSAELCTNLFSYSIYFLWQLKKNLPQTMMVHFYTSIIESILTSFITIWYAAATAKDKSRLRRIIHSPEKVIGCNLLSLLDLYRTLKRAVKIVDDPSHPGHKLLKTFPSGRRLRSIRTRTLRHSFCPSATGLINISYLQFDDIIIFLYIYCFCLYFLSF